LFSLSPGEPASIAIQRLPVGPTVVDAQAYPRACDSVSTRSAPSYVLESPVTVRVDPIEVRRIPLTLVRAGRLTVEVDFKEPSDDRPVRLAVIGDTPYGAEQVANFPRLVEAINTAGVDKVVHVGDIKNGSTRCDDEYFALVAEYFSAFELPLVYTPGDNEWTDCHRANNGAYHPLERLNALRDVFFANPGVTLGEPAGVLSQAAIPAHSIFVENQLWMEAAVVFSVVHVVGSANGYAAWFANDTTGQYSDDPERRIAEVEARIAAALDWIDRSFDLAEAEGAAGLALFMQADTFQGTTLGFEEIVRLLADRARAFAAPVLLIQGDSHRYLVDRPLAAGNVEYGVLEAVPNLTRLVVEGETIGEWLQLSIDPGAAELFTWARVVVPPPVAR
jgi:hypothetical protein